MTSPSCAWDTDLPTPFQDEEQVQWCKAFDEADRHTMYREDVAQDAHSQVELSIHFGIED